MFIAVLISLVLIGIRLAGNTSVVTRDCAHSWVGGLVGFAISSHNWMIITQIVLLCVTEAYAVASKYFPSISLTNLLKRL